MNQTVTVSDDEFNEVVILNEDDKQDMSEEKSEEETKLEK
jgi:hypothetical protein